MAARDHLPASLVRRSRDHPRRWGLERKLSARPADAGGDGRTNPVGTRIAVPRHRRSGGTVSGNEALAESARGAGSSRALRVRRASRRTAFRAAGCVVRSSSPLAVLARLVRRSRVGPAARRAVSGRHVLVKPDGFSLHRLRRLTRAPEAQPMRGRLRRACGRRRPRAGRGALSPGAAGRGFPPRARGRLPPVRPG